MKRVLSRIVVISGVVLGCTVFSASYAQNAVKPDAAKGEALYTNGDAARGIISCASCHGAAGNSTLPINPNLAGQAHEYIARQLHDFKPQGDAPAKRSGPNGGPLVMTPMVQPLTDEDIQNIAYYLGQQPLDYEAAATATKEATMERGQQIWRGGVPDKRVPACAGCHAPDGSGVPAEFPRLAGQFPSYIEDQLKQFRNNDRQNAIMHDIADRMSDSDIAAVADYAAGLR